MRSRPTIFIGSSSERLAIVQALCTALRQDAEILRWDRNPFSPGRFTLEGLEGALKRSDFAIFVFSGEDIVSWRKKRLPAPRDNVVLEIGMAIGIVGPHRLLLLYSQKDRAKIPSDLQGFNYLPLEDRGPRLRAIAQVCELIRQQLIAEGLRELGTDSEKLATRRQRSVFSRDFASKCIRTFDTFGGDLSWLQRDLSTYRKLAQRGVAVRFLTNAPKAPVIREAKRLGMLFRQYPLGTDTPISASLSDAKYESQARALVVQKQGLGLHADGRRKRYEYRMKIFSGSDQYTMINALRSYFDLLFSRGKHL